MKKRLRFVSSGVSFMMSTPIPRRRKKSEREARLCSSHLMQFPITKILRDNNRFFYDLVKVRKMVKKYSKSVNAKEELYKPVKVGVVVE